MPKWSRTQGTGAEGRAGRVEASVAVVPKSVRRPRRAAAVLTTVLVPVLTTVLTAALTAVLVGIVGAAPASAHDELVSTDPAAGATVATAPDQVTLTFTDKAIALGTEVKVTAPDGSVVSGGDPQLGPTTVVQPLTGPRPAGTYTVVWRVTSADGHPVSGTYTFTASTATGMPVVAPSSTATSSTVPTPTATTTPTATPTATPGAAAAPSVTPSPSATPAPAGQSGPLRFWPFLVVVLLVAAVTSALGRRNARRAEGGPAQPKP